ncbi:Uncharacterised protein [Bordetella pertussis]|nr:Uncharacterised protein [Bordetella pertussis]CPN93568.1 Uncharacterised protein [Bordetella pertussis]CRD98351.1 Uncharacterised protein [Bordetella pertussis]
MAQEVGDVQLVPEGFAGVVAQARQAGQAGRLVLALGQHGVRVGVRAAQRRQGQAEKVFQQLALPGVPDARAGAADVGHGQQVEGGQAAFVAHLGGEVAHHLRVGQVALLGDRRHQQVMAHQELDQLGIGRIQAVVLREAAHLARAQFGMIAAAALGDIVEQRRDIQQPVAVQAGDQLAGQRVFLGVLGHGEAAQVAHDRQGVLVDRIDMEQVVLHLADDAPEHRQVARQDVEHGHAAQLVDDAARLLQDLQEQLAVDRIAAELRVDAVARMPDGAQRAGRHADQFRMLLHHQEGAQQQRRIALEAILAHDVQPLAQVAEIVVDQARVAVRAREQPFLDVLYQDDIELGHQARGPVITLHQQFAGAPRRRRRNAIDRGQARLQVEQDAVFAPARQQVQLDAQALEGLFGAPQIARFGRGEQAGLGHLAPAVAEAGGAGHPQDDLQVAQAARRLLAIGFQRVGRVLVVGVALLHLHPLGLEEHRRVQPCLHGAVQALHERAAAGQPARFQQRRLDGDVAARLALAVFQRAHAMAGFQAQVPQGGHQCLDRARIGRRRGLRQQDQQVDVGMRIQFAAAIAADRRQGGAGRQRTQLDQLAQRLVDDAPQFGQQHVRSGMLAKLRDGCRPGGLHALLQRIQIDMGHGAALPRGGGGQRAGISTGRVTKAGGAGMPGETVSTS